MCAGSASAGALCGVGAPAGAALTGAARTALTAGPGGLAGPARAAGERRAGAPFVAGVPAAASASCRGLASPRSYDVPRRPAGRPPSAGHAVLPRRAKRRPGTAELPSKAAQLRKVRNTPPVVADGLSHRSETGRSQPARTSPDVPGPGADDGTSVAGQQGGERRITDQRQRLRLPGHHGAPGRRRPAGQSACSSPAASSGMNWVVLPQ